MKGFKLMTTRREICPTCKGQGTIRIGPPVAGNNKPKVYQALEQWKHGGHVEYLISRDQRSAKLSWKYRKKGDDPGPPQHELTLGKCMRSSLNGFWIGHHRDGYRVYFVTPQPIGMGMITGQYRR